MSIDFTWMTCATEGIVQSVDPEGVGFRKQKIGIEIEQRHRGIDPIRYIDENHVFRAEAASHDNLLAVSLNSSRQYILWLLRLERSTQVLSSASSSERSFTVIAVGLFILQPFDQIR